MIDEIIQNKLKNKLIKWLDKRNFFYPGTKILFKIIRFIFNLKGVQIYSIGQSHLDACWRWVKKDTIRKNYITFTNALEHIEMFPFFKFSCSSPQYFEWMERYFPNIFKKIQQRVNEGRIELLGGMWIEPDMNLISGESIVRQRLYGQRYYLKRFGKVSEVAWLSDTFGYNWQLPQILTKSGGKYFYTNKMCWNAENEFPFAIFYWKSPDGSKILTYSFPYSLNLLVQDPNIGGFKRLCSFLSNADMEFNYDVNFEKINKLKTKQHVKELGLVYGIGDGGGGPLLEEIIILKDLMRQGQNKFITALDYFKILERYDNYPIWNDELYLEFHRGVYTTQAWIKDANRRMEIKLKNLEIISVLATFFGSKYPEVENLWRLLLFNQFHDILPGSSIPEVYKESKEDFRKIKVNANKIKKEKLEILTKNIDTSNSENPIVIFNTISWDRAGIVKLHINEENNTILDSENNKLITQVIMDKDKQYLLFNTSIPSLGYSVFNLKKSKASSDIQTDLEIRDEENVILLENKYLSVQINKKHGCISSIYHKILDKEIISGKANWIQMYKDDLPKDSAWNIDRNYYKKLIEIPDPYKVEIKDRGPLLATVKIYRRYNKSKFVQIIKLYSQIDLLEFTLDLDFNEKKKILKLTFPLTIKTEKFYSEIPFGVISRPTKPRLKSQLGRWEVPAQRWIDLSNDNFGVTLINYSKYGFNAIENVLKMTILRTPQYPRAGGPLQISDLKQITDLGKHFVKYALKIHDEKNFAINEAHQFNDEFLVSKTSPHKGKLPKKFSFLSIEPNTIILSAFKSYEDGKSDESRFILRIYEAYGNQTSCKINFASIFKILKVYETDLLELNLKKIKNHNETTIEVELGKFEIKTLLISLELSENL